MRRLWALPVVAHLAALTVVLLGVAAYVGTDASFSADEGAAITQARALARDGTWIVPHPLPEIDPEGRLYPLEKSTHGPKGFAPFARHPAYALLLAGADRVGGTTAMVLLSVAGTVVAAAAAAALARRLSPALARPAVWTVGVASPLLFDSQLVMAHALGAGAAGVAVLAAVRYLERPGLLMAMAAGAAAAFGALLRTEALILAAALAAALVLVGRRRGVVPGVLVAGTAAAAHLVNAAVEPAVVGGERAADLTTGSSGSFLTHRADALARTWLQASLEGLQAGDAALLVALVTAVAAAAAMRRGVRDLAVVLAVASAIATVARLVVDPPNPVPGLFVAFPALAAGLLLLRRRDVGGDAAATMAWTSLLFAGGVALTQYEEGGTGEWGGRYFALALPVAVPLALAGLRRAYDGLEGSRAVVAGAVAAQAVAFAILAAWSLRASHDRADDLVDAAARAAPQRGAVLVTSHPVAPRVAWSTFRDQRWLLVPSGEERALGERLREEGITRLALVEPRRRERLIAELAPFVVGDEESTGRARGWRVVEMRAP